MKRVLLTVACLTFIMCQTQAIGIEECRKRAVENYPLIKQYGLIKQTELYNVTNANRRWVPTVSLTGKATYQSEVTQIPISLPGIPVPSLSKDQYQIAAEVNQTIWDGGMISAQKKLAKAGAETELAQTDVELYALNERVDNLFFGILLLDEQLKQNRLYAGELQRNYNMISSLLDNGVANQADLDAVKVAQLECERQKIEIETTKKAFSNMLESFVGTAISGLEKPALPHAIGSENNRPELNLFAKQTQQLSLQRKSLLAGNMPKFNAFVQGGFGRPGLNMLSDSFDPFLIGGIRLSWNFGGLYTQKNDLRKIELNKEQVNVTQKTFEFNTRLQVSQIDGEIEKYAESMKSDTEIIRLRENIRKAAEVKVKNGTITVTEYLNEVTAKEMAQQSKILREVELLKAIYNKKTTLNN